MRTNESVAGPVLEIIQMAVAFAAIITAAIVWIAFVANPLDENSDSGENK